MVSFLKVGHRAESLGHIWWCSGPIPHSLLRVTSRVTVKIGQCGAED